LDRSVPPRVLHSFPTRRSSDLASARDLTARSRCERAVEHPALGPSACARQVRRRQPGGTGARALTLFSWGDPGEIRDLARMPERSEEHTSELQSRSDLVCRLLL